MSAPGSAERLLERFRETPLIVFWESTRACRLACKHCRADAVLKPLPGELTTREAKALVEQVASFGSPAPLLVITGGDPLMREDLFDVIDHASSLGVPVALAPSVTQALGENALKALKECGVRSVSISLDGASERTHDWLRGASGNFRDTIRVIRAAVSMGIPVQVNTAVWRGSLPELPELAKLVIELGASAWELFFLVVTGRAREELDISPEEYEAAVNFLVDVTMYGIKVRAVEAPFFRRAKLERLRGRQFEHPLYHALVGRLRELLGEPARGVDQSVVPTRDGCGIVFVAYDGTIHPSGFLPYPLGNVRRDSLIRVYREHPLLQRMRAGEFRGRCGRCEYRLICGGSRARAYAQLGDPLAEDPACVYVPRPESHNS
jgi:radical SAM protein